jgi:hypothetical protein
MVEPGYNKKIRDNPESERDWLVERFTATLKCNNKGCEEVVVLSGDITQVDDYDEEFGHYMVGAFEPTTMHPAPPIFPLPNDTPLNVARELNLAFEVFWADEGCAAAKIRTSVERLMDHFKVVRYYRSKDKKDPSKKGKLKPYDLSVRIDKFASATKQVLHKETLHALRVAGNIGVHKNALSRNDLLDAFHIYEEALSELIGQKSKEFSKLVKKIKALK